MCLATLDYVNSSVNLMEMGRNNAMVVAHPDDETIWGGGLLARYGHLFTVICCSIPLRDPVRAEKFYDACDAYHVKPILLPYQEEGPDVPLKHMPKLNGFDCIVTHNIWGEYGHLHHKQLYHHVINAAPKDIPIYTFGSRPDGQGKLRITLTHIELAIRESALQCYDHILPYCGRPITKWQALLERYGKLQSVETYDSYKP